MFRYFQAFLLSRSSTVAKKDHCNQLHQFGRCSFLLPQLKLSHRMLWLLLPFSEHSVWLIHHQIPNLIHCPTPQILLRYLSRSVSSAVQALHLSPSLLLVPCHHPKCLPIHPQLLLRLPLIHLQVPDPEKLPHLLHRPLKQT